MSADTKKKEFLGSLYREGRLYMRHDGTLKRFDHDFPHLATGKIIPHGVYDIANNTGFMTLGQSAETPAFVAESIGLWWNYRGRYDYPGVSRILLLMDGGGANSSRSHAFKNELIKLATRIDRTIQVAHYPPYCSKWNPIEHRLFPAVTKCIQGVALESADTMGHYINERARTTTGLITRAYVFNKVFSRANSCAAPVPETFPFVREKVLPQWNYTCFPSKAYVERLN